MFLKIFAYVLLFKCLILIVMFKFVVTQFKVALPTRFKFVNKHTHAGTQFTHQYKKTKA